MIQPKHESHQMSTVKISGDRWEKLEKLEVQFTLKRQKIVKKSEIINFLLDTQLDNVKMNKEGEFYLEGQGPKLVKK